MTDTAFNINNGLAVAIIVALIVIFYKSVLPWWKDSKKTDDEERRAANERTINAMQQVAEHARQDSKDALNSFTSTIAERDRMYLAAQERSNKVIENLTTVVKELKNNKP